ncbi:thymidylate synthase [Xenorhabdus nematophila]|nr:thymidylate synthase [Xenorhabdus nematophila]
MKNNKLYCETISRSTDVITGLPYDMGFFSFVHELVWQNLIEEGMEELELGSTIMKTTFTQIYNNSLNKANEAIASQKDHEENEFMPIIVSAKEVVADILNGTKHTNILTWIHENAK